MHRVPIVMAAALLLTSAAIFARAFYPKQENKFRDCRECPEMIVVPAGRFLMGSPSSETGRTNGFWSGDSEGPQHQVNVSTFAIGVYDITRGEYAKFVQETGHPVTKGCLVWTGRPFDQRDATKNNAQKSWRNPGFEQTDRDPVVCLSYD